MVRSRASVKRLSAPLAMFLFATTALASLAALSVANASTMVTVPVAADATVDRDRASTPNGSANEVLSSKTPDRRAYVRFAIPQVSSGVERASLAFYVPATSSGTLDVFLTSASWSETTLTYNNAPRLGTKILSVARKPAGWVRLDVTPWVQPGQQLGLAMRTTTRSGSWRIKARESGYGALIEITPAVEAPAPEPSPSTSTEPVPIVSPTPTETSTPAPTATPTQTATPAPEPLLTTGTYYLDSVGGSDTNSGTSAASAWKSLAKATAATFVPGERLLLKRGGSWSGGLTIAESGVAGNVIGVGAYGEGALPVLTGASDCLSLNGAYISVTDLELNGCSWAGVAFSGANSSIERSVITGNAAGVHVRSGALDNRIVRNQIVNNTRMSVLTVGGDDDSGAFGVLLQGDRTEVGHNTISGHDAFSYDYGRDGAAVEIYGARTSHVHHNVSVDNHSFTELGNSRSADTTYAYNVVRSALANSTFLITRGAASGWGPVANTRVFNNTVVLTGSGTQGFICHAGCSASILTMRNNIVQAVWKVGYADAAFDGSHNIYWVGQRQFALGSTDLVTDPRFVSTSDLRLTSLSPAINSGVDLSYTYDLLEQTLVGAPDRGSYEFQA